MINNEDGDLEYWQKKLESAYSVQNSQRYISLPVDMVMARENRLKLCKQKIAELEKTE